MPPDDHTPKEGDRMLIGCRGGGPSFTRLVHYPPPLEIPAQGGIYVLVDKGPTSEWHYDWVPDDLS
jgi:hypothetical protein